MVGEDEGGTGGKRRRGGGGIRAATAGGAFLWACVTAAAVLAAQVPGATGELRRQDVLPAKVEGGEKADPAETIYVDRKLLEDLGQWLGSLKEKQLNRIMSTLRRRQKQWMRSRTHPPTPLNFRSRQRQLLERPSSAQDGKLRGQLLPERQRARWRQLQLQKQRLGVAQHRRPLDFMRQRALGKYQSAWSSSSSSSSPSSPPAAFPIDLDAEEVAVLSAPADPTETYNDRRSAGEEGGGGGGGEEGAGGGRGRKKSRKKVAEPEVEEEEEDGSRRRLQRPLKVWDFSLI